MIRRATTDDLDYFLSVAERYLRISAEGKFLTLDKSAARKQMEARLINNWPVYSLVDSDHRGLMIGELVNSLWNPAERLMVVNCFWIEPEHRGGRLASDFMSAIESTDAKAIMIDTNESLKPEETASFYKRRGYRLMQKLFVKVK